MNKKILLFSILLIATLALGFYFSYNTFNKPIITKEIKDSTFSILLANEKDVFIEEDEWYEAKIEYPKQNQKVRDQIFKIWQDFATENELKKYTNLAEAKAGLAINVDGMKYTFSAEYRLATTSKTLTYIYTIYTFTGGAHGGTNILPITINENKEVLTTEEILPTKSLERISKLALADLQKQKKTKIKNYIQNEDSFINEGVAATRENYSVVWPEEVNGIENVVISFGQYQVGPYSEGIYEVIIPLNSI